MTQTLTYEKALRRLTRYCHSKLQFRTVNVPLLVFRGVYVLITVTVVEYGAINEVKSRMAALE